MATFNVDVSESSKYYPQVISKSSKDIKTMIPRIINNEKGKPSRILYCGPNFSNNGMALYRIIELSKGNNFLEKVEFDRINQTISSTMILLDRMNFHRLNNPFRDYVNNNYLKESSVYSSNTLYRQHENGHIKSFIIIDNRNYISSMLNFYNYWKLRSYSKK